jgi:hypothetical protein
MVVIVDNVTSKNEEGSLSNDVIVKASKGIERDIKDLLGYAQTSYFDHRLLTILQHSEDDRRGFEQIYRARSMVVRDIQ